MKFFKPIKIILIAVGLIVLSLASTALTQMFQICPEANTKQGIQVFQGLDGWLFHRGDVIDDAEINEQSIRQLERLANAFAHRNMQVALAIVPPRSVFHNDKFDLSQEIFQSYDNALAELAYNDAVSTLNKLGFLTPDLLSYVKEQGNPKAFSFSLDSHWSPDGARTVARSLAETIQSLPEYEFIETIDYEMIEAGVRERITDLSRYARTACPQLEIPAEIEQEYELIAFKLGDLFSDQKEDIVLWGSSYSNNSSFTNFLQDYLNADVVNYAVPGGGAWSSMLEYFLQEREDYPLFSIWELPYRNVRNDLNSAIHYREVIPTVYGECSSEQSLMESSSLTLESISGESLSDESFGTWQQHRLRLLAHQPDPSGGNDAVKLVFEGEKDPSVLFSVETSRPLAGQSFTQSVWLWTDADQPKNAALYFYALPQVRGVATQRITLTKTPTLYSFSHTFSDTEQTKFMIRIDGIEGDQDEAAAQKAGNYLYAFSPELYQSNTLTLFETNQADIAGSDYYSYLELSDLGINKLELIAEYENGQKDMAVLNRSERIKNNGRFFLELSDTIGSPLKRLSVNLPSTATGILKAKLCQVP